MSALHTLATRLLQVLDAEDAHRLTILALRAGLGPTDTGTDDPILATQLAGLDLGNPVGLAAGFDKNAQVPRAMLRAGFGFVECGTVTPLPQAGNPRPRLFRLTQDRAVINRLGFNNAGLEVFVRNLPPLRPRRVIGGNIGANKESDDRIGDYVVGLKRLWGRCDYLTINISSPNTPGLRALQETQALTDLLGAVAEARAALAAQSPTPIFLKVAPDLHEAEIEAITQTAVTFGLNALIISNTTLARPAHMVSAQSKEPGGLSGAPLMALSTEILKAFHQAAAGRITLIGAGGVGSGADAYAKIQAGASAVQLYSAMVYEGPGLVTRIRRDLAMRLRADGFANVAQAVGTGN